MRKSRLLWAVGIVAVAGSLVGMLAAQTPASPAFEAASVKPAKSGDVVIGGLQGGSTEFRVTNIPLRVLIRQAYGLRQGSELIGGPAWLDTDRFDIVGKMAQPDSPKWLMVRTLLADRFKLVTHEESRELPIYALVVARSDGRLGPKLHPSTCVAGRRLDDNGCGFRPGPGAFVGSGVALPTLIAASLSSEVQRMVVDRTGLTGTFDIDLHWLPDNPVAAAPGDEAVSIFTALQEQLGLKLESTTGPVDVLVIDHVEQPTPD
jgi:uncharacterized protein (TIGR03435 family)